MTLYLKGFSGIDQRATRVAHRIGISYIYVAAQTRAQQRIEPAVHGYNVIALPYQTTQQIRARYHRRATDH